MGQKMSNNKKIRIAAGTVLCAALAFLVSFFDLFSVLDLGVQDLLYRHPRGVSSRIKIIA